jgi:hypothetical protein
VLSLFSGAQVQNSDSTLTHIVVETSTISKNGKVIESKKMYVFDINQSYVLEPTKDDVWLSEAIDHKSCKMIKDVQKNDNTIFIKATKFNRKKTEITYTIPVTKNGLFTINESKNLIGSIDFDLKLIYEPAYKEPIRDTFNTYSEIPLAVVIVPFKDLSKKNRQ